MPFAPPSFPLAVNAWRAPALFGGPPTLTFMGNLSFGKRIALGNFNSTVQANVVVSELLCPKRTDLAGPQQVVPWLDCVEVPAGSGRVYAVAHAEDVGRSFLNEYRLVLLLQLNFTVQTISGNPWAAPLWPVPTP